MELPALPGTAGLALTVVLYLLGGWAGIRGLVAFVALAGRAYNQKVSDTALRSTESAIDGQSDAIVELRNAMNEMKESFTEQRVQIEARFNAKLEAQRAEYERKLTERDERINRMGRALAAAEAQVSVLEKFTAPNLLPELKRELGSLLATQHAKYVEALSHQPKVDTAGVVNYHGVDPDAPLLRKQLGGE